MLENNSTFLNIENFPNLRAYTLTGGTVIQFCRTDKNPCLNIGSEYVINGKGKVIRVMRLRHYSCGNCNRLITK